MRNPDEDIFHHLLSATHRDGMRITYFIIASISFGKKAKWLCEMVKWFGIVQAASPPHFSPEKQACGL
jgi:hypothetical protein